MPTMIIYSMSRASFIGVILRSSALLNLLKNENTIQYSSHDFSTILTSSLYLNYRNAPQSSVPLTIEEEEAMLSIASKIVRTSTISSLKEDPTVAGPLLRLAFHDAATRESISNKEFTGGPNASIRYELDWSENRGLSRPLKVVNEIYAKVNGFNNFSFSDTIALVGAAAFEAAGGPRIAIKLGRKDASKADEKNRRTVLSMETPRSKVETTLPSAGLDSDGLRKYFGALGLTEAEFVALCGAHDLGRHVTLLKMPKECLKNLTRECLENAPVLMPFVSQDPDTISNTYFKKLLKWYDREVGPTEVAFIPTDVALVVDEGLREYVKRYAEDENLFFAAFSSAYVKLVDSTATTEKRY